MKDLEKKLCEKFAAYSILPKAEKRGFIIAYRLLEEEIAELTNENERMRNKQQLAIDSLLKIRTDIFDNSSDQMLVKFGVNKIDTLLHQLTNP